MPDVPPGALTQNSRGEWVPSIPLPFYGLRKRCGCGRKFWTAEGYRAHYALCHVLHLGAGTEIFIRKPEVRR